MSAEICIYCGELADEHDHVVPRAHTAKFKHVLGSTSPRAMSDERGRSLVVPSCRECNKLAGDEVHETLEERRQYVKTKLRRRYRKLLTLPPWSREELAELGEGLRASILNDMDDKARLLRRLAY